MNNFVVFLLCLLSITLSGQIKLSGKVLDKSTSEPVDYADVEVPQLDLYTSANSDGTFYLESDSTATEFVVSIYGYKEKVVPITKSINYDLVIYLEQDNGDEVDLAEVVVSRQDPKYKRKKDNPAWAILKKLWENKKENGLKKVPQYEYDEYEKIQFDLNNIDSSFVNRKVFKDFEFIFERLDTSKITGKAYLPAFINESVYKTYGRNQPNRKERKDLLANKSSGFDDNEIVIQTVKNLYKEYDIYQNRINFFNKSFVSPVARDGFGVYEYVLSDTVEIDGFECFRIKYFPKRKGELTFKGDMYITNKTFAIKEISLESTRGINVNFVRDVFVSLQYDVLSDSVFLPKRNYTLIDMSLISKKDKAKGMFAHRTVSFDNFDFETKRDDKFYAKRYDPHKEGAYDKSLDYWVANRHEKLDDKEIGIYETLDSLKKVPRFKRMISTVETVASGYYLVGNFIDVGNLYTTFGYNAIEGVRLRAGARTYFSKNDTWRAAGYLAYGFRDNQFKYGAEYRHMFNKYNRFQMGIGTKRDVEQLGVQLTTSNGILSRTFASSSILNQGDNNTLSSINKTNFYASIEPWKNFQVRLDATYSNIKSASRDVFTIDYIKDGELKDNVEDFNLASTLVWRPNVKFSRDGIDRYEHSTLTPSFMLRFTKGFAGALASDFDYDKLQFFYRQPILFGSFGRSDVTLEVGKTFQAVPLSLLSIIPGNESYGQATGTFNQLDFYEFVTDTYSTLIFDHHFNGRILGKIPLLKKWKLRSVGFIRAAYGEISDKAVDINRSNIVYRAPDDNIYFEYGFGIENIGFGNIRPLRVNFNWRGNYLDNPEARRFGITLGMRFQF